MNSRIGPDPDIVYPMQDYDKLVFLKNFVTASNIFVGDYTYFDDSRYGVDKMGLGYRQNQ